MKVFSRIVRSLMAVAVVVVGHGLRADPAYAQTRFVWPAAALDLERYATVEECLAATARLRDSTNIRSAGLLRDTMPWSPDEALIPLPAPVLAMAQRCGANLFTDTAPLKDFAPLLQLALEMGRDAEAEKLVQRRLAAIPAKADSLRAAVLDSVADQYLAAEPRRLALAEPILEQLVRSNAVSPGVKLGKLNLLSNYAAVVDDTARSNRAARGILALIQRMTDAEKRSYDILAKSASMVALARLEWTKRMDSLRQGTASYVTLVRAAWAMVTGEAPDAARLPAGERAKPIQGDFWFIDGAQSGTPTGAPAAQPPVRPSLGRVSLVVFLHDSPSGCIELTGGVCWPSLAAMLRRLAQRFPELEITVVTKTYGTFWLLEPPTAAQEAELTRKLWAEVSRVTGTYAVKETAVWRLPGLDRRRIERDDPNRVNYTFGAIGQALSGQWITAFVIDPDGIVVDQPALERENERELTEMIDVLVRRHNHGG